MVFLFILVYLCVLVYLILGIVGVVSCVVMDCYFIWLGGEDSNIFSLINLLSVMDKMFYFRIYV